MIYLISEMDLHNLRGDNCVRCEYFMWTS